MSQESEVGIPLTGVRRKRIESSEEEDETESYDEVDDEGESLGGLSDDARDAALEHQGESDDEDLFPELPEEISNYGGRLSPKDPPPRARGRIIDRVLRQEDNGRIHRYPEIRTARAEVAARTPWPLTPVPDFLQHSSHSLNGIETPPAGFVFRTGARTVTTPVPVNAPVPGEDDRAVDSDQYEEVSPAFSDAHQGSKKGFRRIVATLNNPSLLELQGILAALRGCAWSIVGLEVGDSGTPHLQISARNKDAKTRTAWSKLLPHCWVAAARGTEEHCEKYCKKGGCWIELNRANFSPGQGARMDLEAAAVLVRDQGPVGLSAVIQERPDTFVRFHAGLQALARLTGVSRHLERAPEVNWYIGPSGSGKSHQAEAACRLASAGEPVYHLNVTQYKWVPNYKGQKFIMIHDFRGTNGSGQPIPMNFWLGMMDKFSFEFEEKGGTVPCQAHTFFISSIHHPNSGHEYKDSHREPLIQLLRRITNVYECGRRNGAPVGSSESTDYTCVRVGSGCDIYPPPLLQPQMLPAI